MNASCKIYGYNKGEPNIPRPLYRFSIMSQYKSTYLVEIGVCLYLINVVNTSYDTLYSPKNEHGLIIDNQNMSLLLTT